MLRGWMMSSLHPSPMRLAQEPASYPAFVRAVEVNRTPVQWSPSSRDGVYCRILKRGHWALPHLEATNASRPTAWRRCTGRRRAVVSETLRGRAKRAGKCPIEFAQHKDAIILRIALESTNSNVSRINSQAWSSYKASPFTVNESRKFPMVGHEINGSCTKLKETFLRPLSWDQLCMDNWITDCICGTTKETRL